MRETPTDDEDSAAVVLGYAPAPVRPPFMLRQVQVRATRGQIVFDVIFGVMLPAVCLMLDPFVADVGRQWGPNETARYWVAGVEIVAMAVWLRWECRFGSLTAVWAGVLLAGALFAFVVGIPLVPLSFLGLAVGIGVLGFTPLFTGLVFLRNGVRAIKIASLTARPGPIVARIAVGVAFIAMLAFVVGSIVPMQVNRLIQQIAAGDPVAARAATERLSWYRWFTDMDQVARTYQRRSDPAEKARLGAAYRAVTGADVERRLADLRIADD